MGSTYITLLSVLVSTLGFSMIAREYLASFFGGIVIREVKRIKPGTRVKILTSPVIKGDVVKVGWLRTTLLEVGDGERLPSIKTGRMLLVPNSTLINSPILIYGREVIDQVVAYVDGRCPEPEKIIQCMKEAMMEKGVKVKEVDLYQKGDKLMVYGIYKTKSNTMTDVRSEIMRVFLKKSNGIIRTNV